MGRMKPMTEQHLAIFRRHMVEVIDVHFDLASDEIGTDTLDGRLRDAMLQVPRHLFVPPQLAAVAYQDTPLPIGFDKTLSQPFIGEGARLRLGSLGHGVEIRVGDGSRGWAEHAPFDRILVTAAAKAPPPALLDQLGEGGKMVIPLGDGDVQQLSVVEKGADGLVSIREVMPVRFTKLETMA